MPNGFMPGLTPGLFLQQGRYNNSLDPSSYDPNNFVDPYAAIAMQQQMARQIFQMQNPRLALPQQFGAALGGMAQQLMRPAPADQGQQQQAPASPEGQELHQAAITLKQQDPGMPFNEALYKAADQLESKYGETASPQQQKVWEHAQDWAKKNGYDPNKLREVQGEEEIKSKYKSGENLVLPNGKKVLAVPGTPEYNAYMNAGALKAGDLPQMTPGSLHEAKSNGLYRTYQADAQGNIDLKKPNLSSIQPITYGATVTGPDAQSAWPGGPRTFDNASAAKTTEELTNRAIATKNLIDGIDQLKATATANSIGNPADFNEKALNIASTVGTLAGQLGLNVPTDPSKYKSTYNKGLAASIAKSGVDAEKVKSLMLSVALLDEATNGDKNASDANRKFSVEQHMRIMGEDTSNLPALLATLDQRRTMAIKQLNNEFEGKPNVMAKPPWLERELGNKGKKIAPQAAIDHLKAHPELRDKFKEWYGYLPDGF